MKKAWPDPVWFDSAAEFYAWLEVHHATESEIFVGFYKANAPVVNMTWREAVDQALCFGWIDGVGRRIDEERRVIRFTPRRPGSNWSKINVAKVGDLERRGLMRPAGRVAFENRREDRTGVYSFESDPHALSPDMEARFRDNSAAWDHFSTQPPWYRRTALHWVMTAKQETTRNRRLDQLIENSSQGFRVPHLRRTR